MVACTFYSCTVFIIRTTATATNPRQMLVPYRLGLIIGMAIFAVILTVVDVSPKLLTLFGLSQMVLSANILVIHILEYMVFWLIWYLSEVPS